PGQVSMAGELPLQLYENHSNVINNNVFGMNRVAREPGESNVYGAIQYGRSNYDATVNTADFDSNVGTATLGADVRYTDHISLGAASTFGNARGDASGSTIDAKEALVTSSAVVNCKHASVVGVAAACQPSTGAEHPSAL